MAIQNHFVDGPVATGESFFGRRKDIDELKEMICHPDGGLGVAIIGLKSVGKTSFMRQVIEEYSREKSKLLLVEIIMDDSTDANALWWEVVES